jgi:hypothetical protein
MAKRLQPLLGGLALTLAAGLALGGCSRSPSPAQRRAEQPGDSTVTFANRVWKVRTSSSGEPGTLYAFLSEGTLVIASSHGKPSLGAWKYAGGSLTLVEEGISYPADVLELSRDKLRIRIHSPGQPVELTFAPADAPLPRGERSTTP